MVIVAGCYSGPLETGEQVIRPLREIADPIADLSGPMPFQSVQTFLDADYPDGWLYYWKSAYLQELNEPAIDLLIGHAAARPSPLSSLDIFFLEGAVNRVPADKTAFARRDMPYLHRHRGQLDGPRAIRRQHRLGARGLRRHAAVRPRQPT